MEALRTRIDTLQWELNQLRVENWRLKEENPEASRLVTLEAELEGARGDVARLTERVSVGEREVTSECTRADTASRTQEEEAIKLSDTQEQLRAATTQLESATEQLDSERKTTESLRTEFQQSEAAALPRPGRCAREVGGA